MSYEEDTARPGPAIPSLTDLLTPDEASRITGHPTSVLAVYRSRRNTGRSPDAGPDFVKHGKAVFYPRAAVEAYAARRA